MTTYRVVYTVKATTPDAYPTEIPYYTGRDLAQAIVAMGQAATQPDDKWVTGLSVRLDFIEDVEEVEPEVGEWDFERPGVSLDMCVYANRPQADCAGPRVGVRYDKVGGLELPRVTIMCEHHINHPPLEL